MQSTNVRQIKAALVEQAFHGTTQVSCCPLGRVVAVRRRKGQLLVMIRGWGRWYPVESVRIERIGVERQLLLEITSHLGSPESVVGHSTCSVSLSTSNPR
jgi:hypothetical protein